MRNQLCLFCILICSFYGVQGQNNVYFSKIFDYQNQFERGTNILKFDSTYLFVGSTTDLGETYFSYPFLVKTDKQGILIWKKSYGPDSFGINNMRSLKIDSNHILLAYRRAHFSTDDWQIILQKVQLAPLQVLWTREFGVGKGNDKVRDLIKTKEKGYTILGASESFSDSLARIYLIKTDEQGNKQWDKIHGSFGINEMPRSFIQTPDSGYMVVGWRDTTRNSVQITQGYILRTDQQGNFLWDKTFNAASNDALMDIISTYDGNYLISGAKSIKIHQKIDWFLYGWLIKINLQGNVLWEQTYGRDTSHDVISKTIQLPDSSFVSGGGMTDYTIPNYYNGLWVHKINRNGDSIWSHRYRHDNDPFPDNFYDITRTTHNGLLLVGDTKDSTTYQNMWALKLDDMGCDTPNCLSVGINDEPIQKATHLSIYPNPFHQNIWINPGKHQQYTTQIFNSQGQLVYQRADFQANQPQKVNLIQLAKGLYIIKITTSKGESQVKKIIKH